MTLCILIRRPKPRMDALDPKLYVYPIAIRGGPSLLPWDFFFWQVSSVVLVVYWVSPATATSLGPGCAFASSTGGLWRGLLLLIVLGCASLLGSRLQLYLPENLFFYFLPGLIYRVNLSKAHVYPFLCHHVKRAFTLPSQRSPYLFSSYKHPSFFVTR